MDDARLEQQIAFIKEVDRLKQVQRQSFVSGTRRLETSAEHSWHVALMALVLAQSTAPPGVDSLRVLKLLLIHDLGEIDAGDLILYASEEAHLKHKRAESEAAQRLFGLLPEEQRTEFLLLWEEFETRSTPDAKFAAAIDRLQPLLQNFMAEGATWRRHGVTAQEVYERNRQIAHGSPELWNFAEALLDECVRRGYLKHEI